MKKNIVLVGFMGTGKTTVGQILADQTGMELVDMDSIIVERAGKSISDIFADEGEAYFRDLERKLTQELSEKEGLIISTGGGIVLNNDNIVDYSRNGFVVCLIASPEEILSRVQHDNERPLLAGDKCDKVMKLLEDRKPLYEAIEHKIMTDGVEPPDVAAKIIELYR